MGCKWSSGEKKNSFIRRRAEPKQQQQQVEQYFLVFVCLLSLSRSFAWLVGCFTSSLFHISEEICERMDVVRRCVGCGRFFSSSFCCWRRERCWTICCVWRRSDGEGRRFDTHSKSKHKSAPPFSRRRMIGDEEEDHRERELKEEKKLLLGKRRRVREVNEKKSKFTCKLSCSIFEIGILRLCFGNSVHSAVVDSLSLLPLSYTFFGWSLTVLPSQHFAYSLSSLLFCRTVASRKHYMCIIEN